MERDFLCTVGRKEKGAEAAKETTRTEPADCPAMQWQFPAKTGAAPAFMSFRTAPREEGSKEFSISGFRPPVAGDAFDGIKKQASSHATPHQRQFGFETPPSPVISQLQYGHRAQGMDHGAPAAHRILGGSRMVQPVSSRHPAPFSQANPVLRMHNATGSAPLKNHPFAVSNGAGGSTVGAYGARNPRSQKSTQLTIFYNGLVNVFDNIPVEKAQELMLLASRASVQSPANTARKPDSPISAPAKINVPEVLPARQIVTHKPEPSSVPHLTSTSSPIPVVPVPQAVTLLRSTSNCGTESPGLKTAAQPAVVALTNQASSSQTTPLATTTSAAIMPRAVPQARKASLARFLEKRKERVTTVVPYPTSKSPLESSDTSGSGNAMAPSKSWSMDIAPTSNNGEEPSRFGLSRNISFSSGVYPNTKLQI